MFDRKTVSKLNKLEGEEHEKSWNYYPRLNHIITLNTSLFIDSNLQTE